MLGIILAVLIVIALLLLIITFWGRGKKPPAATPLWIPPFQDPFAEQPPQNMFPQPGQFPPLPPHEVFSAPPEYLFKPIGEDKPASSPFQSVMQKPPVMPATGFKPLEPAGEDVGICFRTGMPKAQCTCPIHAAKKKKKV